MSEKNKDLEKTLDIVGEVLAFLTIALYAVLIINATWSFIPEGTFLNVLLVAKTYAGLAVVAIVGLEAVVKQNFLIRLLFLVLLAVVIIFQFFPGTWQNIVAIF